MDANACVGCGASLADDEIPADSDGVTYNLCIECQLDAAATTN